MFNRLHSESMPMPSQSGKLAFPLKDAPLQTTGHSLILCFQLSAKSFPKQLCNNKILFVVNAVPRNPTRLANATGNLRRELLMTLFPPEARPGLFVRRE